MRIRHQDGWVEERGLKRKRWYGHYYWYEKDSANKEVRKHIGVSLGEKAHMRKFEAEAALRKIIATATKGIPKSANQTLEWFVRERFLPMKIGTWRESTLATNKGNLDNHILPALGAQVLGAIDKFKCQVFLNELAAKGYSFTVVDHCRTMLKAIFEEAVDADLVAKNPCRKVENPETREPEKPVLPNDDARLLLEALPFRDKLITMIAAFCAMRPGEIFGLQWSSWRLDHFQIEGTAWRGTLRPRKAKTRKSKAPVAIPDALQGMLAEWRKENAGAPDDALIFPSEKGTPIRPENWLRRRIKPMAKRLDIKGRVCFQILRRTFATNAQEFGDPKSVQEHLRHSSIVTTLDVYTQPVSPSVRRLVNAVTDGVLKKEIVN